jgi:hypothetical protein
MRRGVGQLAPSRPGLPTCNPRDGGGEVAGGAILLLCCTPSPSMWVSQGAGRASVCRRRGPPPTNVNICQRLKTICSLAFSL